MGCKHLVVGLTGPSGTGKTNISKYFKENGFIIINLDNLVHYLYDNDNEIIKTIDNLFKNVVNNNKIDRNKLSKIVFNNKNKLKRLNNNILPIIHQKVSNIIENNKDKDILLDAPTLFESGIDRICDRTIALLSNRRNRIKRLEKRDRRSKEEIKKRIKYEKSNIYYIIKADKIMFNNNSERELKEKFYKYIKTIKVR